MSYFNIKRGDTSPSILANLISGDGGAANLTGATVRFHMRAQGAQTAIVAAPAIIVSGTSGQVRYDWQPADTATAGRFEAEWQVTYADGTIETFPNNGVEQIRITPDIA